MQALIIYNSYSGKSRAKDNIEYIISKLNCKYNIDIYESIEPKSITKYIKGLNKIYQLIIVLGGDGTINESVNGIMMLKKRPRLAIIPFGTCNDIAHNLGLNKEIDYICNLILNNNFVYMDCYRVNDRYFIYGLACGLLTNVSYVTKRKNKKILGKVAYYLSCIRLIFLNSIIKCRIEFDNKIISGEYSNILLLNTRYLAGFRINNKKILNNHKLNLVLIKKDYKLINIIDILMYFILNGKYKHNIVNYEVDNANLNIINQIDFSLDGELYQRQSNINIECVNNAIEVIVDYRAKNLFFK